MRAATYTFGVHQASNKPDPTFGVHQASNKPDPQLPAAGNAMPFSAWGAHVSTPNAADDTALASIIESTEMHAAAIKESEQNTLRIAENARQVGAETLSALHGQNEQIGRIAGGWKQIESNLNTSDRLIRSIESWGGAVAQSVASWFGGAKQGGAANNEERSAADSASDSADSAIGRQADGKTPAPTLIGANSTHATMPEDYMSQIGSVVSDLRAQADVMHAELKQQSKQLDQLDDQADASFAHMQRSQRRVKGLIR